VTFISVRFTNFFYRCLDRSLHWIWDISSYKLRFFQLPRGGPIYLATQHFGYNKFEDGTCLAHHGTIGVELCRIMCFTDL
jgi:hypothetical protein